MESQPEIATIERCGARICAGNSPIVDHYGFWELNTKGIENSAHVTLLGLSLGNDFYDVSVVDSKLHARDQYGNELTDLVGAVIWIRAQATGEEYGITISEVGTFDEVVPTYSVTYPPAPPVRPGSPFGLFNRLGLFNLVGIPALRMPIITTQYQTLQTYVLDWSKVGTNPLGGPVPAGGAPASGEMPVFDPSQSHTNICPPPIRIPTAGDGEFDPTSRMDMFHTVLFEGDRFDPDLRTVKPAADDDWFNIGCGTHALAKLRLTRNTIHTAPGWRNVQAAFKMLAADYCGTGSVYTVDGEPLVWKDRGAMQLYRQPRELEARWDENGATCLNSPRLANTTSPYAFPVFPWKELKLDCLSHPLPPCAQPDANQWEGNELVVSGNYD